MNLQGVYEIRNKINNKVYIGSTTVSFKKRFLHHEWKLLNNKHKNRHLQSAWNLYGKLNFEFNIIEITIPEKSLEREQFYLDTVLFANEFIQGVSKKFKKLGYNINPEATGTSSLNKETIVKRSKSFKKFMKSAMSYYHKVNNNELDLEEVPVKFREMVVARLNHIPWNKGRTIESGQDYSYLKGVVKTKTTEYHEGKRKATISIRNNADNVYVLNLKRELLKIYDTCSDVETDSLNVIYFNLKYHMIVRNPDGRNGKSWWYLAPTRISTSRIKREVYKGLIFTTKEQYLDLITWEEDKFHEIYKTHKSTKYFNKIKWTPPLNSVKSRSKYTIVRLSKYSQVLDEFRSVSEIRLKFPTHLKSGIIKCCSGRLKSYKGDVWRYRLKTTGKILHPKLNKK